MLVQLQPVTLPHAYPSPPRSHNPMALCSLSDKLPAHNIERLAASCDTKQKHRKKKPRMFRSTQVALECHSTTESRTRAMRTKIGSNKPLRE